MVSRSIDPSSRFWHENLFSFISWQNQRAGKDSERVEEGEREREGDDSGIRLKLGMSVFSTNIRILAVAVLYFLPLGKIVLK